MYITTFVELKLMSLKNLYYSMNRKDKPSKVEKLGIPKAIIHAFPILHNSSTPKSYVSNDYFILKNAHTNCSQ